MPEEVQSTRGTKLLIKVEDPAAPGVYETYCTINAERGIRFTSATSEDRVVFCDDPDALAWLSREKDSLSMSVTGGGVVHKPDIKRVWDFYKSPDSRNAKAILDDDDPDNVITFSGKFHLTDWDFNGQPRQKVRAGMTFASDGEITATFGANVGGDAESEGESEA